MDRLNFIGGANSRRSVIASAQRCVNYYPEVNPKDSVFPVTLYQRPGLRQLGAGVADAGWRGLWQASNGLGYGVAGQNVYSISPSWQCTKIGSVTPGRSNICSMVDNGTQAMLVDGSTNGWEFNIADGSSFATINDPTGTFQGADRVDTLDTYILWNMLGTTNFGSTLSGEIVFDALYFAGKVSYPDLLQTLIVNRREIILLGLVKSEQWYDAGNTNLPFASLPGAYIEHGTAAKYSVASTDIAIFWLCNDLQGDGPMVMRQRGYETKRISNNSVEYAIQQMAASGADITDAIGFTWQQGGHVFYQLTFPSGNQTWVYDDSIGDPDQAWHQEAWTDTSGGLNRHRANCFASLYGQRVCGDWQNGSLYAMDPNYFYDQVSGAQGPVQGPISFIRGFPHLLAAELPNGQFVPSNGRTVHHQAFWLSVEAGTCPEQDQPAQISLRYSDDWGKTFTGASLISTGAFGEYSTLPQQATLGLSRFRLYEIQHSIPSPVALNGAWVQGRLQELNR